MPQEGTFEAALSATETQAAATLQSAAALTRELKRVKAGRRPGSTRELRRALETAETLATQLAEAARSLRAGYDFDEQAYLSSGAYAKELLAAAASAGRGHLRGGRAPPLLSLAGADPAPTRPRSRSTASASGGCARRWSSALLAAAQRRGPRFRPEPFLDSLRTAYELVVARDGKKPDAVVRLIDIWAVLTVLPGQGREYTKQEFARDLYLLDQSGLATTSRSSRRLRWSASTGTKGAGVLTTVTRGGQQRRYWGIGFSLPSQAGGADPEGDFGPGAGAPPIAGG